MSYNVFAFNSAYECNNTINKWKKWFRPWRENSFLLLSNLIWMHYFFFFLHGISWNLHLITLTLTKEVFGTTRKIHLSLHVSTYHLIRIDILAILQLFITSNRHPSPIWKKNTQTNFPYLLFVLSKKSLKMKRNSDIFFSNAYIDVGMQRKKISKWRTGWTCLVDVRVAYFLLALKSWPSRSGKKKSWPWM